MHVVVTGAGGFIGGAVCGKCLEAGWQVTGVYRRRLPGTPASPHFRAVQLDLRDCSVLPARFDALVHCAAEVPATCPDPDELYRSNVAGTEEVLARARAAGARRIVYMSSMAVYGRISVPEVNESTPFVEPEAYGRSKAEGEHLLAKMLESAGGAGIAIRLPGIVGRGSRNNFLSESLRRILNDEPIKARNPAALFNNVVHVHDLADFTARLLRTDLRGMSVMTIAARDAMPLREVLSRLCTHARREGRIEWTEGGNPFLIAFDRALEFGYRPSTVASAIERFVADTLSGDPFA